MRLESGIRVVEAGESNLSLQSAFVLGLKELYRPTFSYRFGLLWLLLDPFLTAAIYGFLLIVVRGNFQGWSVLLGVLTLMSMNRPISSNVTGKLTIEPFPLMHTPTRPILVSKFVTSGIQSLLVGLTGSAAIYILADSPISLFIHLPMVCLLLSFFGVSIGLLISPISGVFKDIEKFVSYALLAGFFLQAVLYEYSMTTGLHRDVLSIIPHTLGVEWVRSIVSGVEFPFSFAHSSKVIAFWLLICIYGISRINRARWRLTTWD